MKHMKNSKKDSEYHKNKIFEACKPFGISGYEDDIRDYVKDKFDSLGIEYRIDNIGNIIGHIKGKQKDAPKIMLTAHMDTCGLLVKGFTNTDYWSEGAYIVFDIVGGFDRTNLSSSVVEIKTEDDYTVSGIISDLSVHLVGEEEARTGYVSEMADRVGNFVIDIGAKDAEDIRKLGVNIGSPIRQVSSPVMLTNNIICGPGMDDRVGIAALLEIAGELKGGTDVDLFIVCSVCEEVDLSGCACATYGIAPDFIIGIDTTMTKEHMLDDHSPVPYLGRGPSIMFGPFVDRKLSKVIEQAASNIKISVQRETSGTPGGVESYEGRIKKAGYKVSQIGIPTKYLHTTVEAISLNDYMGMVKLLMHVLTHIKRFPK